MDAVGDAQVWFRGVVVEYCSAGEIVAALINGHQAVIACYSNAALAAKLVRTVPTAFANERPHYLFPASRLTAIYA
jgi:hypothetical protein